jgi:HAD superfamily hydrolase (TIGR01549 family)
MATIRTSVEYPKNKEVLYPGVKELLVSLSNQYKLGIIANQSMGTEDRLVRWGIRDYFSIVFASAERGLEKPDPQIFAGAMAEARFGSQEVLMVGDRLDNDIAPAKLQGWRTVRVLQGFSRYQEPRVQEQVPDTTISKIGDLRDNEWLRAIAS